MKKEPQEIYLPVGLTNGLVYSNDFDAISIVKVKRIVFTEEEFAEFSNQDKWVSVEERLPEKGDEYLVVWDLGDGEPPLTASMDFDAKTKTFTDPRGVPENSKNHEILFWMPYPSPPKTK